MLKEMVDSKKPKSFNYNLLKGSDWQDLSTVIVSASGEIWDEIWAENEYTEFMRKQGGIYVNDAFIELWGYTSGLLFLDGGYGSSKTTYAITRLLVKCLENPYFKCFYGRQKKTEARELHDNIIREIERNGWGMGQEGCRFKYSKQPTGSPDIVCDNGNSFKLFGCDDVDSLKGIDNPSDILIDEINQISFESFGMLWTRLRTPGCELQLIGCFNNCDVYPDHWLVKYIYGNEQAESEEQRVLLDALRESNIKCHHSVYTDNKFQNPEAYKRKLIIKAGGDPDKIRAYCAGEWGVDLNSQPYYKMFKKERDVHIPVIEGLQKYNPKYPLHVSWDENVNPYLPCIIAQIIGTKLYIIYEIAARNPYNTLRWVCDHICEKYPNHTAGMFIYGDATSKKDDVKQEKGKDFFTLACEYLKKFKPERRVPNINPNNAMRQAFLNAIFGLNYEGIEIIISPDCKHMIEDLQHTKEDPNKEKAGRKDKKTSMVNGVREVQKYGHFGDTMDYLVCEYFMSQYILFQTGGQTHPVTGGGRVVMNSFEDVAEIFAVEDEAPTQIWRRRSNNSYD